MYKHDKVLKFGPYVWIVSSLLSLICFCILLSAHSFHSVLNSISDREVFQQMYYFCVNLFNNMLTMVHVRFVDTSLKD